MFKFLQNCKFRKKNNHISLVYNSIPIEPSEAHLEHSGLSVMTYYGTHKPLVLYLRVLSQLCLSILLALEDLALGKPSQSQGVAQGKGGMRPITQTHIQSRFKQSRRRPSGSHTLEESPRKKLNRNLILNHEITFFKYDFLQRVL